MYLDTPVKKFDVPPNETPAMRCPYCDRPMRSTSIGVLHIGNRHADECTEEEMEEYEAERSQEEYDLITFHLTAAVSVFLIYFMFTFLYALIWA